jgi:hypothetical protein
LLRSPSSTLEKPFVFDSKSCFLPAFRQNQFRVLQFKVVAAHFIRDAERHRELVPADRFQRGLEFAGGIPGTVGGGAVMNAGAHGQDMRGTLLSVDGTSVTIALGRMHASMQLIEIAKILPSPKLSAQTPIRPVGALAAAKLDLRGARVEDALAALEARISAVLMAGGEQLEVIHGVGTGALRDAVRRRLRELPEVREVRTSDEPSREGVTFAIF